MSCDDLITNEDLAKAKKEAEFLTLEVESPNYSEVTPEGQAKRTVTGRNQDTDTAIDDFNQSGADAIDDFNIDGANALGALGGVHIGDYSANPLITERNQYATFGVSPNATQWKITNSTSLNYQIDSATYPDPEDDPNLIMFNDVTREYVDQQINFFSPLNKSVSEKMSSGVAVSISIVGDSITWGSDGNDTGVQVADPYPSLLQAHLREFYNNDLITVVNNGTSGYDSQNIIDNTLAGIVAQNNDMYIIGVGANDARTDRSINVEQYKANIEIIYNALKFAAVSFVSITEVSAQGTPNAQGVDDYRQTAKKFALANKLQYIDMWSEMTELLKNRGEVRGKINRDRIHWSQEGYQLIADQVFLKGFANYDLKVKGGQFIDAVSQAFRGSDLGLVVTNSQYTVSQKLAVSESASLFLYVDEVRECDLVLHASLYVSSGASVDFGVTVNNTSMSNSPLPFALDIPNTPNNSSSIDYPISVCRLRKGLNIVKFTTSATQECVIQGFSINAREGSSYSMPSDSVLGSDKYKNTLEALGLTVNNSGFEALSGKLSVGASDSATVDAAGIIPIAPDGETRLRIRGYFASFTTISLGQSSGVSTGSLNWASEYIDNIKINVRSTQTIVYHVNSSGSNTELGQYAMGGSADATIDIITSNTGTSFYINGNLIATINVKLPVSKVAIYNENGTNPSMIESISLVGATNAPNSDIPGESFYLYSSNEAVQIDTTGTRKSVSYT